ncbi:hypothetical protein EAKF1_ch3581c [Escherichia albertii KF1]|nr:hypothetical protein EAKF1_ch3581c [Escherichia albertii KF1]OSL33593.1 hypothetical protein EAPG_02301 [Escherichia albertii B156]
MTCKDSKKVSSRSLIELNDRENEYHQGRNKLKAEKYKRKILVCGLFITLNPNDFIR